MVYREVRCFHPVEDGLGMSSVKIRQHTLRLNFLECICSQKDDNGEIWKEDSYRPFPSLESVHIDDVVVAGTE